jgi:predicted O-linked N-acetylglucosamine transferase (SPINDLY family)
MRSQSAKTQQAIQSALDHLNGGKLQQAASLCQEILKAEPENAEANHMFGIINCQAGKIDAGIPFIRKAIQRKPDYIEAHKNLGYVLKLKGDLDEAVDSYLKVISLAPDYAEVHNDLGNILQELGKLDAAAASYKQALAIKPGVAGYHSNLGSVLKNLGRIDEAMASHQAALAVAPDYALAHNNLGIIYGESGNFKEAEACYRKAISCKPDFAEAYNNLGNILIEKSRHKDSLPIYQKALSLNPDFPEAIGNLGKAQLYTSSFSDGIKTLQKALALQPEFVEAHCNLGNGLKMQGHMEEAIASFRKALSIKPDCATAHSSILFTLNYLDGVSQAEIYKESLQWDQQQTATIYNDEQPYKNNCDGERRLKVGYVSPDFREHSVVHFFEPVLKAHNKEQVEIFCYANVKLLDNATKRLQAESDHWISIVGQRHEDIAERIRQDRIDILVDLAGHTGDNSLLIFAHKPAPIQVSWLGYPNTTGLQAIDYRLTDDIADPVGEADSLHTEILIRLEHGFLCYQALENAPEVSELPCLENGYVTFGSFNNLSKVTPQVVACWSEILRAVPGARLILKSKPLADKETKARYLQMFEEKNIQAERIELLGWLPARSDHLDLYNSVDIGLDPFPYNGTTTTCEALWMGVPVVTLRGDRHAGRVGASIMHHVDLPELVADAKENYVALAIDLANDPDRLVAMRSSLRQHMQDSVIMDTQLFTRSLENTYRQMWIKWCESNS